MSAREARPTLDHAVFLVLLTRLLPLVAAPVTLWLIASRRPAAEQGLYFIFVNVQALAQVMELGIGAVVVQFASHESPALEWSATGQLAGDAAALERIRGSLHDGMRWFGRIALALILIGAPAGLLLFRAHGDVAGATIPWIFTITCTAAYLPLVPVICTIEGCGRLPRVQRMRLAQNALAVAALWLCLPTVGALWGIASFAACWLLSALVWLWCGYPELLRAGIGRRTAERVRISTSAGSPDLIATLYRSSAAWLAVWAAPQSLVPSVLAHQGAMAAGQVGMTLAIATAPLTLASAWLYGRYPRYGALVARGDTRGLMRLSRLATAEASIACLGGAATVAGALAVIGHIAPALASRALSPLAVLALGVGNVGWLLSQSLSAYLRAWRHEPLAWPVLVGAVLVITVTALSAARFGAVGTVLTHSGTVLVGVFPISLAGFLWLRRRVPASA